MCVLGWQVKSSWSHIPPPFSQRGAQYVFTTKTFRKPILHSIIVMELFQPYFINCNSESPATQWTRNAGNFLKNAFWQCRGSCLCKIIPLKFGEKWQRQLSVHSWKTNRRMCVEVKTVFTTWGHSPRLRSTLKTNSDSRANNMLMKYDED